jgi:hypothetical protein
MGNQVDTLQKKQKIEHGKHHQSNYCKAQYPSTLTNINYIIFRNVEILETYFFQISKYREVQK